MNWVVEELLDADFGDFRLSDRVIQLVEKLSQRRLNGVTAAQAALPDHPHQVVVADRESDLYDLFAMPPDSRTDLLVRMRDRRRRLEHPRSAPFFTRRQGPRPGETAR